MKTRFRFSHRAGGRYHWVADRQMPGDSRTEHVNCNVDWFWNPEATQLTAQLSSCSVDLTATKEE